MLRFLLCNQFSQLSAVLCCPNVLCRTDNCYSYCIVSGLLSQVVANGFLWKGKGRMDGLGGKVEKSYGWWKKFMSRVMAMG